MLSDPTRIVRLLWMMIFTVWMAAAYSSNEPIHGKADWRSRIAVCVVGIAWVLLLARRFAGPFSWHVTPPVRLLVVTGFALTLIGLSFALWARYYLGRSWDAFISLKKDHKLVRTGPYAIVRHPIYSGFMVAATGTAFVIGELRCFIAAALVIAAWSYKSGLEELFLLHHFGSEYQEYRHKVKRLLPYVW
jgi:protein-S-isoprenylcysteine O-methyltransferase Ste14